MHARDLICKEREDQRSRQAELLAWWLGDSSFLAEFSRQIWPPTSCCSGALSCKCYSRDPGKIGERLIFFNIFPCVIWWQLSLSGWQHFLSRRLAVQMMFPDLEAELEFSMRQKPQWFGTASCFIADLPAFFCQVFCWIGDIRDGDFPGMIAMRASNNYYYALAAIFSLGLFGVSLLPAEYDRIFISLTPLSFLSIRVMSRLCSMGIDSCDPAFAIWMPRPVEGDTTWNNIEHHCCIWPSKRSIFVCNELLDAMMLSHRVHINTFEDL